MKGIIKAALERLARPKNQVLSTGSIDSQLTTNPGAVIEFEEGAKLTALGWKPYTQPKEDIKGLYATIHENNIRYSLKTLPPGHDLVRQLVYQERF